MSEQLELDLPEAGELFTTVSQLGSVITEWHERISKHVAQCISEDIQPMFEELRENPEDKENPIVDLRPATEEETRGFKRGLLYAQDLLETMPIGVGDE